MKDEIDNESDNDFEYHIWFESWTIHDMNEWLIWYDMIDIVIGLDFWDLVFDSMIFVNLILIKYNIDKFIVCYNSHLFAL